MNWIKPKDVLRIPANRMAALLFLDIMAIWVASFGAIFLRFELNFTDIPVRFMNAYGKIIPWTIIETIAFFMIWKL